MPPRPDRLTDLEPEGAPFKPNSVTYSHSPNLTPTAKPLLAMKSAAPIFLSS